MPRADQIEFARRILLRLLEARQRSQAELRTALARKNVPGDIADELLTRFREVGLVDDAAFASALTSTRTRVGLHGRARIRQELRHKGIDDEIVARTLSDVDPDDELAAARQFGAKKCRSMHGLEPHVARRRLEAALARRGFSSDVVRTVSEEALAQLAVETGEHGP